MIVSHQRHIVKIQLHHFHTIIGLGSSGLTPGLYQIPAIHKSVIVIKVIYFPHSVKYLSSLACRCAAFQNHENVIYIQIPIVANTR